jgi:hypothetical protein
MSDAALLSTVQQPPRLLPTELLVYSTVRIECDYADGEQGTGTGFFFAFAKRDTRFVPAIVTNKHVVEGAFRGSFSIHLREPNGLPSVQKSERFTFEQFRSLWIPHSDPSVDLCVLPITGLLQQADQAGRPLGFVPLDLTLLPSDERLADLTPLEEVLMIGYPNGIWDSLNNMPILRRGVTATHPAIDYEGRKEFMIDAACFPGSSGSPVFLYSAGVHYTRQGGVAIGGHRLMLLGVLYAGPQHTVTGALQIVTVPTRQEIVAFSRIPNNLGVVIKASRLQDFETLFQQSTANPS